MPPRPSGDVVRNHLEALPLVEEQRDEAEVILNEQASQMMVRNLDRHQSRILTHVRQQAVAVTAEELPDFEVTDDGEYVIMSKEALGDFATKNALRGASQAIYDIGHVMLKSRKLEEEVFGLPAPEPDQLPEV